MENKKTAVEWLVEQLRQFAFHSNHHLGLGDIRLTQGQIDELEEQAKEMEKQQIEDAFGVGCHHESKRLVGYQDIAEQYYNKTYGGNK